ncbi:MAG: metal ABC transporter permease, partial [Planctomycetota bacterium]
MRTLDALFGPSADVAWPPVVAAVIIAALGGLVSPLVVHRRLAFIGQGVSHAAFLGVGLAMLIGVGTGGALWGPVTLAASVAAVCVASALVMAGLTDSARTSADAAIGIVLVVAMAAGFLLSNRLAPTLAERLGPDGVVPSVEGVLFGALINADWWDAVIAGLATMLVGGTLWWFRRPITFWAFDEPGARAFGVS